MAEREYPQYEWVSDLINGKSDFRKLKTAKPNEKEGLIALVEKGKQAYKELNKLVSLAKKAIKTIKNEKELQNFKDTAIYGSFLYNKREISRLLRNSRYLGQ